MKFLRKGDSFVQDTSPTYSQDLIPVITSEQQLTDGLNYIIQSGQKD